MSESTTASGMGERSLVGREDLLSVFDEAVAAVQAGEPRVLAFHGIGGIGKSRLIRRLRGEGEDPRRIPEGVVDAKIDLQDPENRLPPKALERARTQFHRQGIPFEVIGTLEDVPVLGLVSKIPKALVKLSKAGNEWWRKRGQAELAHIAALTDHNEIAGWLPRFFGADLSAWIEERDGRGAVLLFDTHEALFTERGSVVSGEAQDTWLRQWAAAVPGVLVVVSGRNPLNWTDEEDWTGRIDQHRIAELDPEEAEPLYRRGLEGSERVLGADHPDTLTSVNNLGVLRKKLGQSSEAEEFIRRALEGAERKLSPEHPHTRTYRANLQSILSDSSD